MKRVISNTATDAVSWAQVIVLSIVQGLTEFLPVSSSGHLRIVSELFWGNDAGASFTAVIQLGTELAVLVYFAPMIWQILSGWFRGWADKSSRGQDWRMGWMVIVGSIPIGVIGLAFEDAIRGALRNLWVTAAMLILFSFVFIAAEKMGKKERGFEELTMKDAIVMGLCQCLALIPGVSRSGGTISGGLFLGLDREVATRFSFLLAIPAGFGSFLASRRLFSRIRPSSLRPAASGRHWHRLCTGIRLHCVATKVRGQPLLLLVRRLPHPGRRARHDPLGIGSPAAALRHTALVWWLCILGQHLPSALCRVMRHSCACTILRTKPSLP